MRFGFVTRLRNKAAKVIGWILRVVIILATVILGYFCVRVVIGSCINTSERKDYAIVLGLALENGQPAAPLLMRLDAGKEYLDRYPETKLILTGGIDVGSGMTETKVMRELLAQRGVPDSSMILEDDAASTIENIRYVADMVDPAEPVVLISSGYHMNRAVRTAEKTGFKNIRRLPAPSPFLEFGENMLSEVVLSLNETVNMVLG